MSEVKWIKITTGMFEDEKIEFIESLPEADAILIIWIKLLTTAGKVNDNGRIYLTETINYDENMLSHKFRRPINIIRLALETLQRLGMIEISASDGIRITNWEKHQNIDGLDKIREQTRKRVAAHRERKALEQNIEAECNVTGNDTVTSGNAIDIDIELEIDKDIYSNTGAPAEETVDNFKPNIYIDLWNSLNLSKVISIKGNRRTLLNARLKEYGPEAFNRAIENIKASPFLKGQNDRNWIIDFDWLIKPNNYIKVIEGKYNRDGKTKPVNKNRFDNFAGQTSTMTDEEINRAALNRTRERMK